MKAPERFAGGDIWYRLGEAFANFSGRLLVWAARCWARSDDPRRLTRLTETLELVRYASADLGWDYTQDAATAAATQKGSPEDGS